MFQADREALRQTFRLSQPTLGRTMAVAAVYTAQAAVCVVLLTGGYHRTGFGGVTWAIVSAVLALQPGLQQSVVTSVIRILANTVGAGVGLLVGQFLGTGEWQLILAIAVVVPTCELLRLNLALRTACVAAIIVLTVGGGGLAGHVPSTAVERFAATVVGCGAALLVQLTTDAVRSRIPARRRRTDRATPS